MTDPLIQLLCLDIDGTLLNSMHRLPPENRAAVREAERRGVTVCLMSARPPGAVVPIVQELGITGPMACYNGGLILQQDICLADQRIANEIGLRVQQETQRCGVHLSVYRDWDWLIEKADRWSVQESAITGLVPTEVPLRETLHAGESGAHKYLCMGEPEKINTIAAVLDALHLPVQLVRSKDTYLEILPLHADKAFAMTTLCRTFGITAEQTMSIGDHDNDCGMLRAAAYGVAMGNASKKAKQAAAWQTRSNDEAGVAYAIHRWILNRE